MTDLTWVKEVYPALGKEIYFHVPKIGTVSNYNATEALMQAGVSSDLLGFLYRRSLDLPYCEGKYGGLFYGGISESPSNHLPERSSVASAPVVLLCGLHMLFMWRHDSGLLHLISTLFAVNGFSAFLAHYFGTTSWHQMDAKSMLLAVWLG